MNGLAVCSGIGGLELGLKLALGNAVVPVVAAVAFLHLAERLGMR